MKWNKYRMSTTTAAVDMVSYTLGELGIEGIEIEDKVPLSEEDKKRMFIDLLPDVEEDDGKAYVSFYIEPERIMKTHWKKSGLQSLNWRTLWMWGKCVSKRPRQRTLTG